MSLLLSLSLIARHHLSRSLRPIPSGPSAEEAFPTLETPNQPSLPLLAWACRCQGLSVYLCGSPPSLPFS